MGKGNNGRYLDSRVSITDGSRRSRLSSDAVPDPSAQAGDSRLNRSVDLNFQQSVDVESY